MGLDDPKDLVRRGYDALAGRYEEAFGSDDKYRDCLAELRRRLPAEGGAVLDLGCGNGVPVARELAAAGHRVTGVDFSATQLRLARRRVPGARFLLADATRVEFAAESFDAVVAYYSLIHLPLAEQPPLLRRIAAWLRPGGWFVGTTGDRAWTGTDEDWLGGGAPMWWSHPDVETSARWLAEAGLTVARREFVPEGDGGHVLFWARRP